jgi:glycosyltransferase involved in cell wall biosynthesis
MKIAVNSRLYLKKNAGVPYYIKLLYEHLQSEYGSDKYVFFQTSDAKRIGTTRVARKHSIGRITWVFDLLWTYILLLSEKRVRVFHGPAGILPVFKKRGVKYVVTIHDLAFERFPQNNGRLFNFYYHWSYVLSLRRADAIIAVSENTKWDLVSSFGLHPSKITTVYLGVNKYFFEHHQGERIIQEKYFFSVTTHPVRKNIMSVLEFLPNATGPLRGLTYVIAGIISETQTRMLKEKIEALGLEPRVRIFGYATEEELYLLYSHAEFCVYPSFYEGFGIPILEAMLCECPVLAGNNSSMRELIQERRWLVNPYEPRDIGRGMERVLALSPDGKKALTDQNYKFAKEFTWQRAAGRTHEVFERILRPDESLEEP